tara:strand:+ start:49 stop:330 length:282 start_codon:yes stop_codon:yes gene_type:complete
MAKITQKQADDLVTKGALTKTDVEKLQSDGLIASRVRTKKRFIKTANNTWVVPQFYYQGLNGADYSKNMTKLHNEVKEVITKHTTDTTTRKNK